MTAPSVPQGTDAKAVQKWHVTCRIYSGAHAEAEARLEGTDQHLDQAGIEARLNSLATSEAKVEALEGKARRNRGFADFYRRKGLEFKAENVALRSKVEALEKEVRVERKRTRFRARIIEVYFRCANYFVGRYRNIYDGRQHDKTPAALAAAPQETDVDREHRVNGPNHWRKLPEVPDGD